MTNVVDALELCVERDLVVKRLRAPLDRSSIGRFEVAFANRHRQAAVSRYRAGAGKTAVAPGQPIDLDLGARNIGPDKAVLGATYRFTPAISVRLQSTTLFDRDINIGRNTSSTRFEEHFDGYTLFDAAVTWRTSIGTFGLGIENLQNRQYYGYYAQADVNAALSNKGVMTGAAGVPPSIPPRTPNPPLPNAQLAVPGPRR